VKRCRFGAKGRMDKGAILADEQNMKDNECKSWRRREK